MLSSVSVEFVFVYMKCTLLRSICTNRDYVFPGPFSGKKVF